MDLGSDNSNKLFSKSVYPANFDDSQFKQKYTLNNTR